MTVRSDRESGMTMNENSEIDTGNFSDMANHKTTDTESGKADSLNDMADSSRTYNETRGGTSIRNEVRVKTVSTRQALDSNALCTPEETSGLDLQPVYNVDSSAGTDHVSPSLSRPRNNGIREGENDLDMVLSNLDTVLSESTNTNDDQWGQASMKQSTETYLNADDQGGLNVCEVRQDTSENERCVQDQASLVGLSDKESVIPTDENANYKTVADENEDDNQTFISEHPVLPSILTRPRPSSATGRDHVKVSRSGRFWTDKCHSEEILIPSTSSASENDETGAGVQSRRLSLPVDALSRYLLTESAVQTKRRKPKLCWEDQVLQKPDLDSDGGDDKESSGTSTHTNKSVIHASEVLGTQRKAGDVLVIPKEEAKQRTDEKKLRGKGKDLTQAVLKGKPPKPRKSSSKKLSSAPNRPGKLPHNLLPLNNSVGSSSSNSPRGGAAISGSSPRGVSSVDASLRSSLPFSPRQQSLNTASSSRRRPASAVSPSSAAAAAELTTARRPSSSPSLSERQKHTNGFPSKPSSSSPVSGLCEPQTGIARTVGGDREDDEIEGGDGGLGGEESSRGGQGHKRSHSASRPRSLSVSLPSTLPPPPTSPSSSSPATTGEGGRPSSCPGLRGFRSSSLSSSVTMTTPWNMKFTKDELKQALPRRNFFNCHNKALKDAGLKIDDDNDGSRRRRFFFFKHDDDDITSKNNNTKGTTTTTNNNNNNTINVTPPTIVEPSNEGNKENDNKRGGGEEGFGGLRKLEDTLETAVGMLSFGERAKRRRSTVAGHLNQPVVVECKPLQLYLSYVHENPSEYRQMVVKATGPGVLHIHPSSHPQDDCHTARLVRMGQIFQERGQGTQKATDEVLRAAYNLNPRAADPNRFASRPRSDKTNFLQGLLPQARKQSTIPAVAMARKESMPPQAQEEGGGGGGGTTSTTSHTNLSSASKSGQRSKQGTEGERATPAVVIELTEVEKRKVKAEEWACTVTTDQLMRAKLHVLKELGHEERELSQWWLAFRDCFYLRPRIRE